MTGQFAARILAGIFSSASLAVAQAYAADITPPHLRAMGMGYLGAAFGVGFIFGPALGGLIGSFAGLSWPLYVSGLLALVNLVYIAALPAGADPRPAHGTPPRSGPPAAVGSRLRLMASGLSGPVGFLYLLTFARDVRLRQPGRHVHVLSEAALPLRQPASPSRAACSPISAS